MRLQTIILYTASVCTWCSALAATPQPCAAAAETLHGEFFALFPRRPKEKGRLEFDSYMSKSRRGRRLTLSGCLPAGYTGWISAFHCA
jgi:hypothetical protein